MRLKSGETMSFTWCGIPVHVGPAAETWYLVSDSHAGALLPPSDLYSVKARSMMEQEARAEAPHRWPEVKFPTLRCAWIDVLLPTKQEEATPMHTLYAVTLIDSAGNIELDRKVVAKTPEAAKLKAGVYGWCEEHCQTLDDVTVLVFALGQVKAGEK